MKALAEQISDIDAVNTYGRVVGVKGLMVEIAGPIHAMSVGARIVIETGSADVETLHERANRQKGERQSAAETAFMNDPNVQQLIQQQGARVVPDSIRPYDE